MNLKFSARYSCAENNRKEARELAIRTIAHELNGEYIEKLHRVIRMAYAGDIDGVICLANNLIEDMS